MKIRPTTDQSLRRRNKPLGVDSVPVSTTKVTQKLKGPLGRLIITSSCFLSAFSCKSIGSSPTLNWFHQWGCAGIIPGKRKQYKSQRGWSLDRLPLCGSNCLTAWTLYFSGRLWNSIPLNACHTAVVTSPTFSGYLWLISCPEGVRILEFDKHSLCPDGWMLIPLRASFKYCSPFQISTNWALSCFRLEIIKDISFTSRVAAIWVWVTSSRKFSTAVVKGAALSFNCLQ